jgi:hypothetical protein
VSTLYTDFSFLGLDTDIRNKTVTLEFTMDIDPETLSDATIEIFERQSKNFVEYDLALESKKIIITFRDWPLPNIDYIARIQNLKSITGNDLTSGIRRPFKFASNVLSTVVITYPAFDEQLVDLKMEWQENPVDNKVINSYYIEISTENAFHNIVLKTSVLNRQFIDLKDLSNGQYYARVRAQIDDGTYGYWSDLVTFIVANNPEAPGPIYEDPDNDGDIDDPIYVGELSIIDRNEDGYTPKSFIIEFDEPIDPESLSKIVLIRRDI